MVWGHSESEAAPFDRERARVLTSAEAAAFVGLSLAHFRRLYRAGKVPAGIRVGERKLGWQVGALADWLAEKAQTSTDTAAPELTGWAAIQGARR